MTIPIGIVGIGKIARDQHLPTIAASGRFHLAGAVSLGGADLDVPVTGTLAELKRAVPDLAAVSLCTPPMARAALIREAFHLGLDVLVEKPPAATVAEAEGFAAAATQAKRTLYFAWHSREANGVEPLRRWLRGRTIQRLSIRWREDARVWHPGQEWIWEPGIGVFDPGINALSILTRLLPAPVAVETATLGFPANRAAPVDAMLGLASEGVGGIDVDFSFDQRGPQTWTLSVETDEGPAELRDGGARLFVQGEEQATPQGTEYGRLYDRFADLIATSTSDADLSPFRLVADAFLVGRRVERAAFEWNS